VLAFYLLVEENRSSSIDAAALRNKEKDKRVRYGKRDKPKRYSVARATESLPG
jgi:hypothetical protein